VSRPRFVALWGDPAGPDAWPHLYALDAEGNVYRGQPNAGSPEEMALVATAPEPAEDAGAWDPEPGSAPGAEAEELEAVRPFTLDLGTPEGRMAAAENLGPVQSPAARRALVPPLTLRVLAGVADALYTVSGGDEEARRRRGRERAQAATTVLLADFLAWLADPGRLSDRAVAEDALEAAALFLGDMERRALELDSDPNGGRPGSWR